MANTKRKVAGSPSPTQQTLVSGYVPWIVALAVVGVGVGVFFARRGDAPPKPSPAAATNRPIPAQPAPQAPATSSGPLPDEEHMETQKAVMVTVDLDYGPNPPPIAEAIKDVERRYQATDGRGRTFAILDAYGEPTPDGKLHMSMHVSSEKPGLGSLVWKRTGQVLWRTSIEGSAVDLASRKLGIFIKDERGNDRVIDGSNGPSSILDAMVKDLSVPVHDFWPDGQEREVTFVYSACGCPVKTMVKRVGDRTVRTKDLPVIFPDDPGVVTTISALMKW
jgi:hypothetical protein